jgi:hypothetical protein
MIIRISLSVNQLLSHVRQVRRQVAGDNGQRLRTSRLLVATKEANDVDDFCTGIMLRFNWQPSPT